VSAATPVAGLPLLRRIVLAGTRAGFDAVLVHRDAGPADLVAGTPAAPLTPEAFPGARGRVVILPANVVPQPRWLRALREAELAPEKAYVDSSLAAVIETEQPARVLAAAAASRDADEAVAALGAGYSDPPAVVDAAGRFPLATVADVPAAERWLLRSLVKQSEGFMSRHVERRISLAISARNSALVLPPGVTPWAVNFSTTSGNIKMRLSSALRRSTISFGVPAVVNTPTHCIARTSGKPASAVVATSGNCG